ncbi:MAG: menaquinol-cytochrome C reductase iron-sulfur subunit [Dehalococcoidia bacterium]|nr:MAG: menaquinol-cytochrome C reductase iron-sulfur subunit [Dehalococcoidia bacterium]
MITTEGSRNPSRRRLLERVVVGAGGLISALVAIPPLAMFLGPMFRRVPEPWRTVGRVNDFRIGETVQVTFENASPIPWSGQTGLTAAWLRRESEGRFIAFSVNCAHLGCPVRWEGRAQLFFCPCHGGTYYADGSVAAGPPPRGLSQYAVRVQGDQVQILASPLPL